MFSDDIGTESTKSVFAIDCLPVVARVVIGIMTCYHVPTNNVNVRSFATWVIESESCFSDLQERKREFLPIVPPLIIKLLE